MTALCALALLAVAQVSAAQPSDEGTPPAPSPAPTEKSGKAKPPEPARSPDVAPEELSPEAPDTPDEASPGTPPGTDGPSADEPEGSPKEPTEATAGPPAEEGAAPAARAESGEEEAEPTEAPGAPEEGGEAVDEEPTPRPAPEVVPGQPSKRESEVLEAVSSLKAGGGDVTEQRHQVGNLRKRLTLWDGEVKVEAAQAARQRSDLHTDNRELRGLLRSLPWAVRKRRVSLAEARERRNSLVERQGKYDQLYDTLDAAAEAASERLPGYEAGLQDARSADLPSDVLDGLKAAADRTRKAVDDYQAAADLAVENSRLAGEIVSRLDPAIDAAEAASFLRRSQERVSASTFRTAYTDTLRLAAWLWGYVSGRPEARAQYDLGLESASPLGLAGTLTGIVLAGGALFVGWRRAQPCVLAAIEQRCAEAGAEAREAAAWRATRGLDITRAVLAFTFLYLALSLLPLELRTSRALLSLIAIWAGYFAGRPALRLILSPREGRFRLFECDDPPARRTFRMLHSLMLVSAVLLPIISALSVFDYTQTDVRIAAKLLYGTTAVFIVLWLINAEHDPTDLIARPGTQVACDVQGWAKITKPVVSVAAIALLVLAFYGYLNLAAYLSQGVALTAIISAVAIPAQRRVACELEKRFPAMQPAEGPDEPPTVDTRHMALRYLERIAAAAIAAGLLLRAWNVRGHHIAAVIEHASRPLIDVKGTRISIIGLGKGVLVVLVSYWVARVVRGQIERSTVLARKWDEGVRAAVGSTMYYTILCVGAVVGILAAGLQLTVLAAFAGMVGIAVGFGSQDIAKNIICGLIIMLDRSINVGDCVDVAGQTGKIEGISIRSVTIRTHDNRTVVVPNSTFYTQNVVVSSQRDKCVRVTVDLAVAGETEFATVSDVLVRAARAEAGVLDDPLPEVVLSKLAAGALSLQLIAWTDQIDRVPMVQGHLVNRVWKALKEAEIALA